MIYVKLNCLPASTIKSKRTKKKHFSSRRHETHFFFLFSSSRFPVHRLIMMSASNYFHALLRPNFKGGQNKEVIIADIDGVTLKSIIEGLEHEKNTYSIEIESN